jgi:hypothetical protein
MIKRHFASGEWARWVEDDGALRVSWHSSRLGRPWVDFRISRDSWLWFLRQIRQVRKLPADYQFSEEELDSLAQRMAATHWVDQLLISEQEAAPFL